MTNLGASADDFFYDFKIFGPILELDDFDTGTMAGSLGAPTASYNVEVKVDGSLVFSSAASLNGGQGGHVLTETGTSLGNGGIKNPSSNILKIEFNDFSDNLFLGNFASGQSFLFETLVEVSVDTFGFELGGAAFVGDPGDINNSGGLSGNITGAANTAPEPSTIALLGLGFLGLVGLRRRTA